MPVFKSSHISFRLAVVREPGDAYEDACDDDDDDVVVVVDTIFDIWGDRMRSRLILIFFEVELFIRKEVELFLAFLWSE